MCSAKKQNIKFALAFSLIFHKNFVEILKVQKFWPCFEFSRDFILSRIWKRVHFLT